MAEQKSGQKGPRIHPWGIPKMCMYDGHCHVKESVQCWSSENQMWAFCWQQFSLFLWFHSNDSLFSGVWKSFSSDCIWVLNVSRQKPDNKVHWVKTELNFVRKDIFYNWNQTYFKTRDVFGEGTIARENGRGSDLCVRPVGRGMLNTLHPGKGSLRSSGPICSRRGKWHIIGSRPDKRSVYITLPDTRLT